MLKDLLGSEFWRFRFYQPLEFPPDHRQMLYHLGQSDDGNLMRVNNSVEARIAHALSAHAEELGLRHTVAQGFHQARTIKFS